MFPALKAAVLMTVMFSVWFCGKAEACVRTWCQPVYVELSHSDISSWSKMRQFRLILKQVNREVSYIS